MKNKIKKIFIYLAVASSAAIYIHFGYQLHRADFVGLCVHWILLFLLFYFLVSQSSPKDWKLLAASAFVFRLVLIFVEPNLSQDYYRFIWDGRMLLAGYNPYLSLPQDWITNPNPPIAEAQALYAGMGELNGSHYTNYPPISQFVYWIAALLSPQHILGATVVLRLFLILSDVGIFWIGSKLLKSLHIPHKNSYWYLLNPFVILELTANLHFEALMLFFILLGIYFLHHKQWVKSAVAIGISVSVKLIPLLFLPLFVQQFVSVYDRCFRRHRPPLAMRELRSNILQLLGFYSLVIATVIISFAPFASGVFLRNFQQTIGLWFQNFEFNASIYYIIRWIGYRIVGWNAIAIIGKILAALILLAILSLAFLRKNRSTPSLCVAMLLGISVYYFLSTTVHPWYLAIPLGISIFTPYRFPLLWSLLVVLSYGAYQHDRYHENLIYVAIEYTFVYGLLCYELFRYRQKPNKPEHFELSQ